MPRQRLNLRGDSTGGHPIFEPAKPRPDRDPRRPRRGDRRPRREAHGATAAPGHPTSEAGRPVYWVGDERETTQGDW